MGEVIQSQVDSTNQLSTYNLSDSSLLMSEGIIVSKLQATLVKIKHPFGAGHYSHLGTVKIFFKLQAKLVKHPSPGFAGKLFNYSSYFFWLLFFLFKFSSLEVF